MMQTHRNSVATGMETLRSRVEPLITKLLGTYLYDHEWQLAIILDACRYDMATDIEPSHSIDLGTPEKIYTVGSCSPHWIRRTFAKAPNSQVADTAYICGNPHTDNVNDDEFKKIDKVYEWGWDPDIGTVPPRPITDTAIESMRENAAKKHVVHYMQPHLPPLNPSRDDYGRWEPQEGGEGNITEGRLGYPGWHLAENGNDPETIIKDYYNNCTEVLKDVQLLLNNVDASKVIITADHGNYIGERGLFGHPANHIHPAVRHVPWWESAAENENTYSPASYDKNVNISTEDQLKALGYQA